MTELKTKDSLLDKLKRASSHQPTADELERQRVSFIMGSMTEGSGITRDRVQEALAVQEGRKEKA